MRSNPEENVKKVLKKLGADFIDFTPNWSIVKKLMWESFDRKTDFCWHCHTGIIHILFKLQLNTMFHYSLGRTLSRNVSLLYL